MLKKQAVPVTSREGRVSRNVQEATDELAAASRPARDVTLLQHAGGLHGGSGLNIPDGITPVVRRQETAFDLT